MRGRNGEIAEHEPEPIPHPGPHVLDDRVRLATVRALVIAVLDERHRRGSRSLHVIALLVHREGEDGLPLGPAHVASSLPLSSSSARRMPSAPGFTPTGET